MPLLPVAVRKHLPGWRADAPEAFLLEGRRPDATTVVACVGDSITEGSVSANWVRLLAERLRPRGVQLVNAGVNGNLAYNVAERLDEVIACRPDLVTLLVGTNDVNARFDAGWSARYRRNNHLPTTPDLAFYATHVDRILGRLRAETTARVVALDLPMLGEDLDSRMNGLVAEYNAELRRVAARHGVAVLPLNARLAAMLPPDHHPPPYTGELAPIALAAMRARVLGQTWDEVSRASGLAVLTDHIHLNDRAGEVVAELVQGFAEGSSGYPAAATPER